MILARKLLAGGLVVRPSGQQIYGSPGTFSFVVPAGVTSICIAAVGAGVDGMAAPSSTSGGGGACAWTNNIAVTPGETLTVQVGVRRERDGAVGPSQSWVRRSGTNLVMAVPGTNSAGGLATSCVGVNRFSGASGGTAIGGSAAAPNGTLPAALFGYGGTGVVFGSSSWSTQTPLGNEEQRRSGAEAGGGGAGNGAFVSVGAAGAVCIIWGPGRGFSTASTSY